jgi:predicted nucleic acid-binding protein
MTTALDTNVLVALWQADDSLNLGAQHALDHARLRGDLTIAGPVYAELLAFPGRGPAFLEEFCRETLIRIDWEFAAQDWRDAGKAFQAYASRRRKARQAGGPRRILADFLIGAHASRRSHALLTLDGGTYRAAFPTLKILEF